MKKFKNDYFKEVLMRTYWGVIGSVLKDSQYNHYSDEQTYEVAIQIANQHQTEALTRRVK